MITVGFVARADFPLPGTVIADHWDAARTAALGKDMSAAVAAIDALNVEQARLRELAAAQPLRPLVSVINGVLFELVEAETARIEAEWAAVANAPPPVPASVTPLQMRRALRAADLKDQVDGLAAQLGEEAEEAWQYALEIERASPFIAQAAQLLGWTEQQVDDLFRLAATL